MKITNPITLDVARSNSYICLLAKQFDSNSRYLEITLADNGQPLTIPADASVVLRATRADGTGAVVSGTVADGKAAVEIDDYILEVAGAVTLSLEISKGGEILTTTHCNLTVQKADASGWIRVYIADSSKAAGNYYITIGGVSYSFTTSQAIPTGGSVYFSSNNATAETRNATGTVIETGLVLTEGTTGTQLVTDVPTMSFLATIAGRVAALESEMPNKADKDGIIALANNLTPYSADSGATQSVPFINQGTGCGNGESIVDTGSYAQIKKKLGNTVTVNQQIRNGNFADSSYWAPYDNSAIDLEIANGIGKVTFKTATGSYYRSMKQAFTPVIGHKYLLQLSIRVSAPGGYAIDIAGSAQGKQYTVDTANVWTNIYKIIDTAGGSASSNILFEPLTGVGGVGDTMEYRNIAFYDLALWFGSNDRIPAHLLSHPEDFGRYYSGSLAYNPGQLIESDGSVLTSIGRNVWDEEWEVGVYNNNTGEKVYASGYIRSKNKISVIPNTQYYTNIKLWLMFYDASGAYIGYLAKFTPGYFTVPANCHQLAFNVYDDYGGSYKNDITISLYYPGESGYSEYYPYSVLAEVDTGSEVLRSAGSIADEKTPDGTITRKILVDPDLGAHSYYYVSTYTRFYTTALASTIKKVAANTDIANIRCVKYIAVARNDISNFDKAIAVDTDGNLFIRDTAYTDPDALATSLSGVALYAEIATPTTEQGTAFAENIPCDDFGSMYWTQTNGVPQGVEIFYPYDYKAAVDTILNEVNGDVTKLVTAEKVPDAPASNGTYVLKVTVSGGTPTYSWVAE